MSPSRTSAAGADVWLLQQLAYRYAAAVDARDVDGFLAVFEERGRLRTYHPGAEEPFAEVVGHDQLASVPNSMRGMFRATAHLMSNHLVSIDGDAAEGSVMCTARHLHLDQPTVLVVVLRYVDRYARRDGEWRISDRKIRFLWSERHEVVESGF